MSFKDILRKNFIKNMRKYLSYFFSGTFCITMFFMYLTLLLLDNVIESCGEYPLKMLFGITSICVAIFSIFFINYSHQNFVRNKKKELGIYMILGMDERNVRKILILEATIIAFASVLSGMLIGTLFSRYFQLIVVKLVDVERIRYQLTVLNFLIPLLVFGVIYVVCFFFSNRALKKEDISTIIKDNRRKTSKAYRKIDGVFALLGMLGICFSTIFILNVAGDNKINSKVWVFLSFIVSGYLGLYFLIRFGGKTLIHLLKKSRHYERKMLVVSEIDHKFGQNLKVMLILVVLASLIVMLVGSPISLVTISSDIAEDSSKDLQFASVLGYNEAYVSELLAQKELSAHEISNLTYTQDTNGKIKPVTSVSEYNSLMNTELVVNQGEIYNLITTWMPGTLGMEIGAFYELRCKEQTFTYQICESLKGGWEYLGLFPSDSILILSDEDYKIINSSLEQVEVHTISFLNGWKDTAKLVSDLAKELGEEAFITSRIETYKELKNGYSVFLFVCCFMCFMFFVSSGSVMYFKQYNEVDEDKEQYKRLYKIGINDKEMKRNISIKLFVVYFVPMLGSIMGMLNMFYLSNLFGGSNIVGTFMKYAVVGAVLYGVSQLIFYIALRANYIREVMYQAE